MAVINLTGLLKELNENKKLTREEKLEKSFIFFLDCLNQGTKEDWKKRKNRALMFTALAEHEWKETKKEALKEIIRERNTRNF